MSEPAVRIENLQKTYASKGPSVDALKGVGFTIEKGAFFGLLGPNGAGKTTLINILAGITGKTAGTAEVAGIDIDRDPAGAKRKIGVVQQEIAFDAFLPVEAALRFQFGYYGQPVDQAYLDGLLEDLSLTEKRESYPRALSGGMKRRFMIAKALVHRPEILVLDEPTAGVDIELRHGLYDLVRRLNAKGTTVILTSHYLEEVELLCERIAILHKGRLVALDTKHDLKDRFQTTRLLSIALTAPLPVVPEALSRFSPELKGSELVLTFEEEEYKQVLSAVADADLPLAHFRVIEPTLEDVFVSLTAERA